ESGPSILSVKEGWQQARRWSLSDVYDFLKAGRTAAFYRVWTNQQVLPRAFIVPQARPLPPREEVLRTFKEANLREVVYLEEFDEPEKEQKRSRKRQDAVIRTYTPNTIRIYVDSDTPGFLVLTDVWFPGWTCTFGGEETKVYRADYTFRAVKVPA